MEKIDMHKHYNLFDSYLNELRSLKTTSPELCHQKIEEYMNSITDISHYAAISCAVFQLASDCFREDNDFDAAIQYEEYAAKMRKFVFNTDKFSTEDKSYLNEITN